VDLSQTNLFVNLSDTSLVNGTLWLLSVFSLVTWGIVFLKSGERSVNTLRNSYFRSSDWATSAGIKSKRGIVNKDKSQCARIYSAAQTILQQMPPTNQLDLSHCQAWHDLVGEAMQQQIRKEKAALDSGLGWLASCGSTSPFVGLFGTVWGIMHALQDISAKGSASLEVVAGPIGEALIATAFGIGVAVPAVLAYNFFVRLNKANLAALERFANDYLRGLAQQHLVQHSVKTHGHATA
jgi:biopolymer transport protein ExbB